jgi:hypothetical protein
MDKRVTEIREILKEFVKYQKGEALRKELHQIALDSYKPKYSPEVYLNFMNRHECSFTINGAQSTNHPYYFTMFSVVSQHVQGDCVQECLDKAIGN